MVTIVVSEELRSLSVLEGSRVGSEEPETEVVAESGDGWVLLAGVGVGGMSIRDGASMKADLEEGARRSVR